MTMITPGSTLLGKIEISYVDSHELGESELVELLKSIITKKVSRLQSRLAGSTIIDSGDDDISPDPELTDFDDEESDDDEHNSAELVQLQGDDQKLIEKLQSTDIDSLPSDEIRSMVDSLTSDFKPGIIIDGQHRVNGTKNNRIPFSVTAMPEAKWPELAFQFIVLNKAAKKVSDSLLINIIGNSLDDNEISVIERRLTDSGVPVPLYQGVMKIHDDPESPFFQKLKFGVKDENGLIDASAAKTKIVNFWFNCKMFSLVKHLIPGRLKQEKIQNWQASGMWYEYLKIFWGTAKTLYEPSSSLWSDSVDTDGKTPTSKLMRVTIINLTQVAIIDHMTEVIFKEIKNDRRGEKTIESELSSATDFEEWTVMFFKRLTPDFFLDWGKQASGFDGSTSVKEAYIQAVKLVIGDTRTIDSLKRAGANQHLLYRD